MTETEPCRAHLIVHGHVQGVGFRNWTKRVADQHCLSGWVRNRQDGTVEILFQGASAQVADAIERCRKGPRSARVDKIDVSMIEPDPNDAPTTGTFAQLPTH